MRYMARIHYWENGILKYICDEVLMEPNGDPVYDKDYLILRCAKVRKRDIKAKEFFWDGNEETAPASGT